MSIVVVHDGTGRGDPMENCAFCRAKTRHWHEPKDVAVCIPCSETRSPDEVPTKAEWLAKERGFHLTIGDRLSGSHFLPAASLPNPSEPPWGVG
jgi:hypothetical protein